MVSDDLDERVRQAGEADSATVERVMSKALAPDAAARTASLGHLLAALAVSFVAILVVGLWTLVREPAVSTGPGVYRATALPPPEPRPAEAVVPARSPGADGIYRASASRAVAPARVIRITVADGTTWILSTDASDNGVPRGSAVIIGGEEEK